MNFSFFMEIFHIFSEPRQKVVSPVVLSHAKFFCFNGNYVLGLNQEINSQLLEKYIHLRVKMKHAMCHSYELLSPCSPLIDFIIFISDQCINSRFLNNRIYNELYLLILTDLFCWYKFT